MSRTCIFCDTDISHRRPQAKKCASKECLRLYDLECSTERYNKLKKNKQFISTRKARDKVSRQRPMSRYKGHRSNAKTRGIPFNLTFDEWWSLWEPHWKQRGTEKAMCRTEDAGAYEVGNVRIDTYSNNAKEYHKLKRVI